MQRVRHGAGWRGGALLALALLAALQPGCGGSGVGSNGTGSPLVAGLSVGTVSGFGSVIVDGVRHDDGTARVELARQTLLGPVSEPAALGLGQRVSLEFRAMTDGSEVLSRIELLPSVVGPVTERTGDTLGVLGQTVVYNDDPTRGPVTAMEAPYARLADVALGDTVEVHGVRVDDRGRLMATRIARRTASAGVRLTAVLGESLPATADRQAFRVGALVAMIPVAATRQPADLVLATGQMVTLFASASGFDPAALTLQAAAVQGLALGDAADTSRSRLDRAGLIHGWDGASLRIDGVAVAVDASTEVRPAGRALGDGMYVRVTAALDAQGRWLARRIEGVPVVAGAELRGTLTGWSADQRAFTLRDTAVNLAAGARIDLATCPQAALADGLYVEVVGTPAPGGVIASSVTCRPEPTGGSTPLDRHGQVLSADLSARALTLQHRTGTAPQAVRWDESTVFQSPLTAEGLAALVGSGRQVEVRGALSADRSVLTARRIRLREAATAGSTASGVPLRERRPI